MPQYAAAMQSLKKSLVVVASLMLVGACSLGSSSDDSDASSSSTSSTSSTEETQESEESDETEESEDTQETVTETESPSPTSEDTGSSATASVTGDTPDGSGESAPDAEQAVEDFAADLLADIRADRHFDHRLFLSEAEFDADPQYTGVNPRPGRNLLERFEEAEPGYGVNIHCCAPVSFYEVLAAEMGIDPVMASRGVLILDLRGEKMRPRVAQADAERLGQLDAYRERMAERL